MAKPGMHKFGDWELVKRLSQRLPSVLDQSTKQTLMQITLKAEGMAVKFMAEQSLSWQPLSRQYLDTKRREGLSTKILIATSTYFQSINSQVKNNVGFAGVLKQVRNDDGEVVADIAKIHEFGSIGRNIPPRRLWLVVFKHMRQFLIKNRIFERNAVNDMRKSIGR